MKTAQEILEEGRKARRSKPVGLFGNEAYLRALAWVLDEPIEVFGLEGSPMHVPNARNVECPACGNKNRPSDSHCYPCGEELR